MDFRQLVITASRNERQDYPILCFDPGHTTGWAFFEDRVLVNNGQIDTTSIEAVAENASHLYRLYKPPIVVMEDYRVYKWRKDHHVGSEMLTTRVIGALELLAVQHFVIDIVKQPAHVAKQFCTDKKLKEWEYYIPGERHARDAIRHGCYYILFGQVQGSHKNVQPNKRSGTT